MGDVSFAVVPSTLKGVCGPVFAASSVDPLQVRLKAALGQRKVCRLRFHLSETKNVRRSHIWRIRRLTDRLDAFAAIKSLLMRPAESVSSSFYRSWPWGDDMGLSSWKIGWDVA